MSIYIYIYIYVVSCARIWFVIEFFLLRDNFHNEPIMYKITTVVNNWIDLYWNSCSLLPWEMNIFCSISLKVSLESNVIKLSFIIKISKLSVQDTLLTVVNIFVVLSIPTASRTQVCIISLSLFWKDKNF
jgi:hypothetical protein